MVLDANIAASAEVAQEKLLRTAEANWAHTKPVDELVAGLGHEPLALVLLFITPMANFDEVVSATKAQYPYATVAACSTAGEIGRAGYCEGSIVAIGFPKDSFSCSALIISDLDHYDPQAVVDEVAVERVRLQRWQPDMGSSFAFLMVDGLSRREDVLSATIAPALRDTPMFGASAGDGVDFGQTRVALNGQSRSNAAVLVQVRSKRRMVVFSHDHFAPTDVQMVVTDADPEQRIVKAINAENAGREYARIIGLDPEQLDRFTFASHPVVVRLGDEHHVRAIQQVNEKGELVFFSAIDEGMVLTVAEPLDMQANLSKLMHDLSDPQPPSHILACDCILRRIEAEKSQTVRGLSEVLSRHHVIGVSTYGEQIGSLHVNQTMTGVAFYPQTGGE